MPGGVTPTNTATRPFNDCRIALSAACSLADHGLDFVVAPIRAGDGAALRRVDSRYAAAVYPFVDGTSYSYGAFQSSDHFNAVVGLVARLHDLADPPATGAIPDDLVVPRRDDLSTAIDELDQRWDSGPYGESARRLLARHAPGVQRMFEHYDLLADAVAQRQERMVLTHGEPHPANTLLTLGGLGAHRLGHDVDRRAERDLARMAIGDASVGDAYEALTGRRVRAEALDCYRLWWDLGEICYYVSLLRQAHDDDADTRESWHNLEHYLGGQKR